jgi:acetylornithine deacetylase/succinyl-diaminopimelate desuccinylase-like protein
MNVTNENPFRSRTTAFAVTCVITLLTPCATAQSVQFPARRDSQVEAIVTAISAERIEATIRTLAAFGTRHTLSDPDHPTRGIGAARRWLKSELDRLSEESEGRLQVTEDEFLQQPVARVPKPVKLVNLVATLPGNQPESRDRWIVVSGHYDSICRPNSDAASDAPGANDDASGTAAVLELAKVMSRHRFDATIVFLAVAGEEQGLLGSGHWAEAAKRDGRDISAMITNDIIGNTSGGNGVRENRRLRVFSEGVPSTETEAEARIRQSIGGENDSPSRQLARYIKEAGERYVDRFEVTLVFRRDRHGRGGDHIPFLQRGFPAVRFTEPNEDFTRQHQKVETENGVAFGDVPDRVDFDYVANVTRVNAAVLASLALAPAPPAEVRFATRGQQYDTVMAWQKNKEPDVSGYRVVWRETYQPFWEHALDVGDVGEATLKSLSKDDLFFAVQAVDRDGHASVPSYPKPPAPTVPAAAPSGNP